MQLTRETLKRLETLIGDYKAALTQPKRSAHLDEENQLRDVKESSEKENDADLLTILEQNDSGKNDATQSRQFETTRKEDFDGTKQVKNADSAIYHREVTPAPNTVRVCSRNCHHDYYQCTYLKGTDVECARILAKCYPSCFQRPKVVSNYESCSGTCMKSFDQCFFITKNQPEKFMCLTARNQCLNECPGGQRKEKRGCNEECAGNYDVCEQMVHEIYEIVQCIGNRDVCLGYC